MKKFEGKHHMNLETFNLYLETLHNRELRETLYALLTKFYKERNLWSNESEFAMFELFEYAQRTGHVCDMIALSRVNLNELCLKLCQDYRDGTDATNILKNYTPSPNDKESLLYPEKRRLDKKEDKPRTFQMYP